MYRQKISEIEDLQKMRVIGEHLNEHYLSPNKDDITKMARIREIDEIDRFNLKVKLLKSFEDRYCEESKKGKPVKKIKSTLAVLRSV